MHRRQFLSLLAALLPASWLGRDSWESIDRDALTYSELDELFEDSIEFGVLDREWYEVTYSGTQQNGEIISAKWSGLTHVRRYMNGLVTRSPCEKIDTGEMVYWGSV